MQSFKLHSHATHTQARRIDFRNRLEDIRAANNGFLSPKQRKQYNNFGTAPNDYIFVGEDGKVWTPPHLRQIMKQFQAVIGMKNPQAYPLYCMRIGAISLANQQKMDLLKVLRYVARAVPKLPHVQHRYIISDRRNFDWSHLKSSMEQWMRNDLVETTATQSCHCST